MAKWINTNIYIYINLKVYFIYFYQSGALFLCLCFCKFVLSNSLFALFDSGTAFVNILLVTNLYRETVWRFEKSVISMCNGAETFWNWFRHRRWIWQTRQQHQAVLSYILETSCVELVVWMGFCTSFCCFCEFFYFNWGY